MIIKSEPTYLGRKEIHKLLKSQAIWKRFILSWVLTLNFNIIFKTLGSPEVKANPFQIEILK